MVCRHNNWSITINNIKWFYEDGYLWYLDISDGMSMMACQHIYSMSTASYSSVIFIYFYILTVDDGMPTLSWYADIYLFSWFTHIYIVFIYLTLFVARKWSYVYEYY